MNADEQEASRFRIGAVARLTGIPVETLRVWERRYQVVTPQRASGGSRLYDGRDVARLGLIKRLVDSGNAISTIAQLSLEQLEKRDTVSGAMQASSVLHRPARVAVIGSTLPFRLNQTLDATDARQVTVVGSYTDTLQFERESDEHALDGLIVEFPVLIRDSVNHLLRLQHMRPVGRTVVVYGYGKRESLKQLQSFGIITLQYPANWPELIRALNIQPTEAAEPVMGEEYADVMAAAPPKRRFDDLQLARITSVTTDINCECPHHIADLVLSLNHFELYSAECENLSIEDAAVHAYLNRATARARSLMESALQLVIETDGINLDENHWNKDLPTPE